MAIVVDLDGVVWLGDVAIPGGAEAVRVLREAGERVVFLTNNSFPAVADHLAKLARMGVDCPAEDLATSAQAAATLLRPGSRALVLGGPGIEEALAARGVETVGAGGGTEAPEGGLDAVVVGFDRRFDFERLAQAVRATLDGAQLVGTNDDATFPTTDGQLPGAGSLLAAVAYASGRKPVVAGKPNDPVVRLLAERVGDVGLVVGDRPSTDGALARRLSARFGLVLTGVTAEGHGPVDPAPDLEERDFLAIARRVAGGAGAR